MARRRTSCGRLWRGEGRKTCQAVGCGGELGESVRRGELLGVGRERWVRGGDGAGAWKERLELAAGGSAQ